MNNLQLKMATLRAAMSVTVPDYLSEKTKREMAAGRASLVRNLADSAAGEGRDELERRFGHKTIWHVSTSQDVETLVWGVRVVVRTAAKTEMAFDEPLLDFPSEFMIAQIALVV